MIVAFYTGFESDDTSLFDIFIDPNVVIFPAPPVPGLAGLRAIIAQILELSPGLAFDLKDIVACKNRASVRLSVTDPQAPPGLIFDAFDSFTFAACKIVEIDQYERVFFPEESSSVSEKRTRTVEVSARLAAVRR